MNDIPIHLALEMPAVDLTGDHEIDLSGRHRIGHEVDGMRAPTPGKQHQVIERMPVSSMKLPVMFVHIGPETANQKPPASAVVVDIMDRINRECLRHDLNIFRFVQFHATHWASKIFPSYFYPHERPRDRQRKRPEKTPEKGQALRGHS